METPCKWGPGKAARAPSFGAQFERGDSCPGSLPFPGLGPVFLSAGDHPCLSLLVWLERTKARGVKRGPQWGRMPCWCCVCGHRSPQELG